MAMFQKFNKKTGRWQVYEVKANGRTIIKNVKQKNPRVPFKGIMKK